MCSQSLLLWGSFSSGFATAILCDLGQKLQEKSVFLIFVPILERREVTGGMSSACCPLNIGISHGATCLIQGGMALFGGVDFRGTENP